MHPQKTWSGILVILAAVALLPAGRAEDSKQKAFETAAPKTVHEARSRARLLHEAFHGALQVMHRDFFDEDESRKLPSASLDDVFKEMRRSHGVELTWLSVNAKAMNVDHEPNDAFEKEAVASLRSGKKEFESIQDNRYRHVGRIRLASQCLKCHLPQRTSTEDRAAALLISMPIDSGSPRKDSPQPE